MYGRQNNIPGHTPIFYVTLSGTRGFPKIYIKNVMVSAGSLWWINRKKFVRRKLPAHTNFFLDSGGFNTLNRFGNYPWSIEEYIELIWHYMPEYVATMDYPCEPDINRKNYLGEKGRIKCALETNVERIKATVDNALKLYELDIPRHTKIIPVIQGYTLTEYCQCVDLYERKGLFDLINYFAIGSMCRRWNISKIARLVTDVVDYVWTTHPNIKFHLFGLKLSALKNKMIFDRTYSLDSAAWSLNPKRGYLYEKNPVDSGYLDLYLSKVNAVCLRNKMQQTLDIWNKAARSDLSAAHAVPAAAPQRRSQDHRNAKEE